MISTKMYIGRIFSFSECIIGLTQLMGLGVVARYIHTYQSEFIRDPEVVLEIG